MKRQCNINTNLIGPISLVFDEKIEEIILSNPKTSSIELAYNKYGPLEEDENKVVKEFDSCLNQYLEKKLWKFDLNILNLNKCSDFQKKVLIEQCETKFGDVNYYKDLAIAIGQPNASRAVGNALRNNPFPIIIPCHRTIKGNNEIGGFAGDLKNYYKKILLKHEGNKINDYKVLIN